MADRNGAAGPPTEALRYSDRDRKRDYRQGRADAKRHLPLVPRQPARGATTQLAIPGTNGTGPSISLTPFLYALFNERNQDLAALYKQYLRQRSGLLDALREADGRRQQLLIDQAAAQEEQQRLDQSLTDEEATRRSYGEIKAGHPPELTRQRRERVRDQERRTSRRQLADINSRLSDMAVAAGRAQGALATELAQAQAAGMELVAFYEQRKASYLSGLAHAHRRNVELLERLALTDPGLPEWLSWSPIPLGGV